MEEAVKGVEARAAVEEDRGEVAETNLVPVPVATAFALTVGTSSLTRLVSAALI